MLHPRRSSRKKLRTHPAHTGWTGYLLLGIHQLHGHVAVLCVDQHALRLGDVAQVAFRAWRVDVFQMPRSDQSFSIGDMACFLAVYRLNVHKTRHCHHDQRSKTQNLQFPIPLGAALSVPPAVHGTSDSCALGLRLPSEPVLAFPKIRNLGPVPLSQHCRLCSWDAKDNFEFERRIGYRI